MSEENASDYAVPPHISRYPLHVSGLSLIRKRVRESGYYKCDKALKDLIYLLHLIHAPAEVSDKRQDRIVADERPQLSREQIDDMNSGD